MISTERLIGALIGPLGFLGMLFAGPDYIGLGILWWLAVWWSLGVVPMAYTAIIPIFGFAVAGIPLETILASFVHPALIIILMPALAVLAAVDCGLIDRLAWRCVKLVGTSVRQMTIFWLVFSSCLSFFAANVVIAIAVTPVVLSVLRQAGYKTADNIAKSKSATLMIIAVAVGASLGGIMTPMAGGQAVITWKTLNLALGGEVTVFSFMMHMIIPVMCSLVLSCILFMFLPIDATYIAVRGGNEPLPWARREKIVLGAIIITFMLPYIRPWLPVTLEWLYFGMLIAFFAIRGKSWGSILPLKSLLKFPLHAFSLWPIAMSVSILIGEVTTGSMLFALLGNFWQQEPYLAVGMFVLFCLFLSQIASDTGSAGIIAPLLLATLVADNQNPIPWILLMGYTVNLSFMVPSATGTLAIPMAFEGRSHFRLPLYGFMLVIVCGTFSWLFWSWVISTEKSFWSTLTIIN